MGIQTEMMISKYEQRIAELEAENERLREQLQISIDMEARLAECRSVSTHWHSHTVRLQVKNERLLVLATKWCDKDHHDWQEILKMGEKS